MTQSEMDEQGPEFFEDYMGGMYDTVCSVCDGKNVVDVVEELPGNPDYDLWLQMQRDEGEWRAEREQEMRMGC